MNEVMTIAGRKLIFPLQGERRAIIERAVIAIETETRALTETDLRMAWIDDTAARDREIAALRDALDGLVDDFVDELPELPDDHIIEWETTLGALRRAAILG